MNTKNTKKSGKRKGSSTKPNQQAAKPTIQPSTPRLSSRRDSEDAFTLGGKRYVARTFNPCKGCVFSSFPGTCSQYARPPCDSVRRKDGRDVFFVLKETED